MNIPKNLPIHQSQACFQCKKCMAAAAAVKDAADCLMTMPSLMLEPLHLGRGFFLGSLAPPWRRYESGGFHWKLAQNGELNGLFNG